MISALYVANTILDKAFNENIQITPMKLQKLIYILYKEYIKKTGKSLFSENFQAWQYGPVLESVYHQFSGYKKNNITDYYYTYKNGERIYTLIDEKSSEEFTNILAYVWNNYKNFSAVELSNFTHINDGAWEKATKNKSYILKDEDIISEKDYL